MLAVLSKGGTCSHTSGFVGKSPGLEARSNAFDMTDLWPPDKPCGLKEVTQPLWVSGFSSRKWEAAGPEGPSGSDIGMTVNA